MSKPEYVDIKDLPRSKRGQKEIPKEWVAMIKRTPVGKAVEIKDLKYTTVQGRIRTLATETDERKAELDDTYVVSSRKGRVFILHIKPEKEQPKSETETA